MTSVEIYQNRIETCYPKRAHGEPTPFYFPICHMVLHWAAYADEFRHEYGQGILDDSDSPKSMVGNEWLRVGRGIQGLVNNAVDVQYNTAVVLAIITAIFANEGE